MEAWCLYDVSLEFGAHALTFSGLAMHENDEKRTGTVAYRHIASMEVVRGDAWEFPNVRIQPCAGRMYYLAFGKFSTGQVENSEAERVRADGVRRCLGVADQLRKAMERCA